MSKASLFFVALSASLLALGLPTAQASTTKDNTTVTKVETFKDAVYFQLNSGVVGENCGANDWAIIQSSNPAFAQQVQVLMAALLSGRTVKVILSQCAAASSGPTYPIARYFDIY